MSRRAAPRRSARAARGATQLATDLRAASGGERLAVDDLGLEQHGRRQARPGGEELLDVRAARPPPAPTAPARRRPPARPEPDEQRPQLRQGERAAQVRHRPARGDRPAGAPTRAPASRNWRGCSAGHGLLGVAAGHVEPFERAPAVVLGVEAAEQLEPDVAERLVVEVDGVLGGEQHAGAERPALLEQGEQRRLGRRHRRGRQDPLHLVEVEQDAQALRARLGAHPREQGGEQQREERRAARARRGGRGRGSCARGASAEPDQGLDRERRAPRPGSERRAREHGVEGEQELLALLRAGRRSRRRARRSGLTGGSAICWISSARSMRLSLPPGVVEQRRQQHVVAVGERVAAAVRPAPAARRRCRRGLPGRRPGRCPGRSRQAPRGPAAGSTGASPGARGQQPPVDRLAELARSRPRRAPTGRDPGASGSPSAWAAAGALGRRRAHRQVGLEVLGRQAGETSAAGW